MGDGEILGLSIGMFVLLLVIVAAVLCATLFKDECAALWRRLTGQGNDVFADNPNNQE
jgi:hypothetical protein